MKMKKFAALILGITMTAVLAGCGVQGAAPAAPAAPAEEPAEETAEETSEPAGGVEITQVKTRTHRTTRIP